MKFQTAFLRSKLARRIFWLFIFCALIPITVLAIVSLRSVTAQLNEQSSKQLHRASKEEALGIYERLSFLEADLKLIAFAIRRSSRRPPEFSDGSNGLSSHLVNRFKGVELVAPSGSHQNIFGKSRIQLTFTDQEQKFLGLGENVLSTIPCEERGLCIFLSRKLDANHPEEGTLVAEIKSSYLWDAENIPEGTAVFVLDPFGRTLFCSAEAPDRFPPRVSHSFSGEFEWKHNGREFLARYWNLPLATSFYATHWTIVISQAKLDVFAPLARFRISFLLVFLLALWVVLLLSLVQIRRSLIPLGKLKEGTRRISFGDFATRVSVNSGDEFEELAASFNSMAGRIERQINSLKMVNELDRAILSAWDIEKIIDTLSSRLGEILPFDLLSLNGSVDILNNSRKGGDASGDTD